MEDRFERVTNLVTFLLNQKDGATFAQILAEIPGWPESDEARRRAFERDKRVLRDEGIPLTEVKGVYRIDPDEFFLPDLDLTADEQIALRLAVAAVPVGGETAGLALHKLTLGSAGGLDETAPVLGALDEHSLLPQLHAAITTRAAVRFTYDGRDEVREVEPALIFFRDGHWYVTGQDRTRGARRNFRVDRIDGDVDVLEPDSFEPRSYTLDEAQPRQPWLFEVEEEPEYAVVEIDAVLAAKAVADVGGRGEVTQRDDGSVVIRMPVTNRDAFLRTWLVGMLDHAVVVEPPALRAFVVEWLEAMA
jgi:predicted DNA-binding transcriptional regulator YafY